MPRRAVSCWIILLALSEASVSITASRSRSSSAICVSTNSSRTSKRLILACAFAGSGSPESCSQFGETTTSVPKQRVVIAHAKRCQNSADPIGQTDALGDEFGPFANTSSGILIGLIGNRHHRAHARLASQPSEKCPKQQLGINTVRLCAAYPTIDRHAGRLDNVHFYSMPHKPAR